MFLLENDHLVKRLANFNRLNQPSSKIFLGHNYQEWTGLRD